MKDNNSKQVLLSVLGVAILVVAVVGVSFAAFSFSKTGTNVNTITTGTITMSYNDEKPTINITDALPMTDAEGMRLSGTNNVFDFTVAATIQGSGTTTINYAVTGEKVAESTLPDSGVKVYLTDGGSTSEIAYSKTTTPVKVSALTTTGASEVSGAPEGQYILDTGTFTATNTKNYRLRMWVADDYADPNGAITQKTYKLRVNVYGKAAAQ